MDRSSWVGCHGRGAEADEFATPGATRHYPPDQRLEPVHLEIELLVDLERQELIATVVHRIRARVGGERCLRLHGVALADVTISDRDGLPLTSTYDGQEIIVVWERAFDAGEERALRIDYRVERPANGVFFSKPSAAYPDAPLFAATDHETERARHWLPTIDLPAVRPTLHFRIRADAKLTALANGRRVSESRHDDGTRTTEWRLDEGCPSYLTCFAVGDFVHVEDGEHRGVPIAYFAHRGFTADDLARTFGRTRQMLQWITERLAVAYPYPKYFQFAAEGIGGAMENISLVSWDDALVVRADAAAELTHLADVVNIHEMAHTWFGDLIGCHDFAHAWLKEGWATYIESCWMEHRHGRDAMLCDLYANAQAYFEECRSRYKRPIVTRTFTSSWDMFDRHLYPGGAWRLHMLRSELGDEVFWPAVTEYLTRYRGRAVETDDFRRILEERSGRTLGKFFDQWLYRAGYPQLGVGFEYDAEHARGTFEIEQKQADGDRDKCFELELKLSFVIDGKMRDHVVRITEVKHRFTFPMKADPDQVRVDRDASILCELTFDPGEARLLFQLADSDAWGRIHAGCTLIERARPFAVDRVRRAFDDEPSWGVRKQWADTLGTAGTESAVRALVDLIGSHRDPMVMPELLRAAGHYRDPQIGGAVRARLEAGDLGPLARACAYEALGKQRDDAFFDLLRAGASGGSASAIAEAGALRGLAELGSESALETLIEHSRPGRMPSRGRHHAAAALGTLARWAPRPRARRARERIADLLRDTDHRVRRQAALALGTAGDRGAIPALEAYRKNLSVQEQAEVGRVIRKLERPEDDRLRGLSRTVDDMSDRLRRLEDRLRKLEAESKSEHVS